VVLLHGYPGNERNLDLAQARRRDGWDIVFFHYRGAWGSTASVCCSRAITRSRTRASRSPRARRLARRPVSL